MPECDDRGGNGVEVEPNTESIYLAGIRAMRSANPQHIEVASKLVDMLGYLKILEENFGRSDEISIGRKRDCAEQLRKLIIGALECLADRGKNEEV